MIDPSDAFFYEQNENPSSVDHRSLPKFPKNSEQYSSRAHLYPIDEAEDFHDPFSDLSLFLAKKIKGEIVKHGSSKQWSSKIEMNLLSGILPEFKARFPKYRLGVNAVKKVWEKVSYYYGKIEGHKEALKDDGKLNVEFMIRENLRGYPFINSSQLPPYHTAHQIAIKMSECIAALDGIRPKLEELSKTIWAVQKHLIENLSSNGSKNIYEDYDFLDRMIVKTLLEKIIDSPLISQVDLKQEILKEFYHIKATLEANTAELSFQKVALILAAKFYPSLNFHKKLSLSEQRSIRSFIVTEQNLGKSLSISLTESSQRIVALYPLAHCLPKIIHEKETKELIQTLYHATSKKPSSITLTQHTALTALILAELHFFKRKELSLSIDQIQTLIIETLKSLIDVAKTPLVSVDEIEILSWHYQNETNHNKSESDDFFKKHVDEALFETSQPQFKKILYQIQECLKKHKDLLCHDKNFSQNLESKAYRWSIQSDMVCRWLHFDSSNSLLQMIEKCWKKNQCSELSHQDFVNHVLCSYLENNTHLNRDINILKKRIFILYKYFWFHHLSDPKQSSLDRYLSYHWKDISSSYKEKSADDKLIILEARTSKALPLTPLSKKQILKATS